ncbi:hypothetical protein P153DRAFT_386219 [Dothidotthia symphoricarpi CBS 119687]|uniref:Uncharacterized protein n=1 Tax=Dothidotthia symphoricarpi CBS 119687 TaxID=1392245 RepID=A0A6A6AD25_9PLEO|nr:uncharacterized protein P153DRAFT_386219 [Dothidotthia symphoricarpi CBS 119687]KAF2129025.1 hypothetical protein P153DRAFT_386219 [Dothidotthia symphoricarpi CBS 119687]
MATTTTSPSKPPHTLASLSTLLLTTTTLIHAPQKPTHPALASHISALALHPTLEATLHILNADLPSAHFLVRHMQAPPAVEGMLLHGILHRCEGDMRNSRLWVGDVADICEGFVPKKREEGERLGEEVMRGIEGRGMEKGFLEHVYGGERPEGVIDEVEAWRKMKGAGKEEQGRKLEESIRGELERVLEWCRKKFGEGEWVDATSAWVKNSEEIQKISDDMVSGDKGWRKF